MMNMSGNSASGTETAPCGHPRQPGRRFCTICGQPTAASGSADTMTVHRPAARPGGSGPVPGAPAWQPGQVWVPENAWPSQPEQPWPQPAPSPGFGQQGQFPAGPGGPGTRPPRDPRSPRWPVVAGIIVAAALLGGGAGAYVLVAHPFSHRQPPVASGSNAANVTQSSAGPALPSASTPAATTPATTTPAGPATTAPASPAQAPAEKQAATALARLLSQSSSDRSAINQAWTNAGNCTALSQDQQTFQQAAANRQSLLSQLNGISGLSSLPAAMVSDLTGAWQASEQVDQDYAQWAGDESASGCTTNDPSYVAANGPNATATADKTAFTNLWNPLAQQYGLPAYDQSHI
jgi:hypothetical protein